MSQLTYIYLKCFSIKLCEKSHTQPINLSSAVRDSLSYVMIYIMWILCCGMLYLPRVNSFKRHYGQPLLRARDLCWDVHHKFLLWWNWQISDMSWKWIFTVLLDCKFKILLWQCGLTLWMLLAILCKEKSTVFCFLLFFILNSILYFHKGSKLFS